MQYGGGVTVLWNYFIKFRYFLNDGFPKVVTMVKKTGGLFSNSVCSRICFERGVINESSVTIIHWQDIRLYEYFPWGKKGWTSCKNINVSYNLWAWSRGTDSEESYEKEWQKFKKIFSNLSLNQSVVKLIF